MSLIVYKNDNCVRNSYFYNSCSNCVSTCPENVFSVIQNKIKFEPKLCTFCSACLGTCPTEAIVIDGIDPNREALEFKFIENNILSCKNNISECLSRFDSHHFSIMAMQKSEIVQVDLSNCDKCKNGSLKNSIEKRIDDANKILDQINIKNIVINQEQKQEKNSSLFAKFRDSFSSISHIAKISDLDRDEINKKLIKLPHLKKMYPVKHKIFISEFRTISNKNNENIEKIKSVGEMISSQDINNNLCTNCGDCSLFCPTGAIFTSSDKLSIWLSSNQCISCGVCNHI